MPVMKTAEQLQLENDQLKAEIQIKDQQLAQSNTNIQAKEKQLKDKMVYIKNLDTIFQVTDMGSNTFRLRNVAYDKCLFGSPNDGGLVMQHGCWSHPDILFEFQGY
jgi:hypothetical protein